MRERGLAAVQPRAYERTTLPGTTPVLAEDLLERDFTADAPGSGWSVTSPTCAPARAGCT